MSELDENEMKNLLEEFPLNLKGEIPFLADIERYLKCLKDRIDRRDSVLKITTWYRNRNQLLLNIKVVRYLIEEYRWTELDKKDKSMVAIASKAIEIVAKRLNITKNFKPDVSIGLKICSNAFLITRIS